MTLILRLILVCWASLQVAAAASVTVLSAGPIVADGETPAEIQLWVPRLAPGSKVKVKPAYGNTTGTVVEPGGLIRTTWIPAYTDTVEDIPVRITVKGSDPIDVVVQVPVVPPRRGDMKVQFDPPLWRPGVASVQVRIQVSGTSPQAQSTRQVLLRANAGTLSEAVNTGEGRFVAYWTPPAELSSSRYVIIGASDAAAPGRIYGWGALPIHVAQSLSFRATPGSVNLLTVGSMSYGPITASPQGMLAFQVPVDPQSLSGQLESRLPSGRSFKKSVDLPLPVYPRVGFLPVPVKVPKGHPLTVLAAVIDRQGKPTGEARVVLKLRNGTQSVEGMQDGGEGVRLEITRAPGTYRTVIEPRAEAGKLGLHLHMSDQLSPNDPHQRAELRTEQLAAPLRVRMEPPAHIEPSARTLSFTTEVLDANNMPTDQAAVLTAAPGSVYGRPSVRDGKTQTRIRIPSGTTRVTAVALGALQTTGLPPARVGIWPIASSVEPGAKLPVILVATDVFGVPVAGTHFKLGAMGGGVLPSEATANASGIALVDFTAGMAQGLSTLRVEAAGRWTSATVWQGSAETGPPASVAADPLIRRDLSVLRDSIATAVIGPPAPVAVAPPPPQVHPREPAPVAKPVQQQAAVVPAEQAPVQIPSPPAQQPQQRPLPEPQQRPLPESQQRPLPPQPPAISSTPPAVEASAAIALVRHNFHQELRGKSGNVPPDLSFERPVSPGLDLQGTYWLDASGPLGLSAGGRFYKAAIDISGEVQDLVGWTTHLGLRYRGTFSGSEIGWFGIADLQRVGLPVVEYSNPKQSSAEITSLSLWGLRLGGGLHMALDPILVDATLAQTFAFAPVDTRIGLGAAIPVPVQAGLSARLGLDVDFKSGTVEVDKAELDVTEQEMAITIGLTWMP